MSPSSVGVIGVAGLSVRGEALAALVAEAVEGSPTGPAGGSMVMAEVQHRSLRRRREVLKTVVSPECEFGRLQKCVMRARGAGGAGRSCASASVCCFAVCCVVA